MVMCHSGLVQPCYLLKGGHCLGLISRHELKALSVGFLFPMDLLVEFVIVGFIEVEYNHACPKRKLIHQDRVMQLLK